MTKFDSNKARALLAYLAIESDRPHLRTKLASIFWPEWTEGEALKHLRHTLSKTRTLLDDQTSDVPFILVTRQTLQFNPDSDHQLDVTDFGFNVHSSESGSIGQGFSRQSVEQLRQGLEIYRGSLLEGFHLSACPEFDDWLLLTRERYQRLAVEASGQLAAYYEEHIDIKEAIEFASRQTALEPWHEDGHRRLMCLFAQNGQRSSAIRQYERCREILATELGVEPTQETIDLARKIQSGSITSRARTSGLQDRSVSLNEKHAPKNPSPTKQISTIPPSLTHFVGRIDERRKIQALLLREDVRLVTITGTGGIGKTRLSQEIGREMSAHFADGIHFIPLASVQDHRLVVDAIAQALNAHETGTQSIHERLIEKLAGLESLLILDNFEHILDAAFFVTDLLVNCPSLKILVTSRETLHLRGEHEFPLGGLIVPTAVESWNPSQITSFSAITLFCQHAQAVRPSFELTEENQEDVAAICQRLDGLPLAIELAAARVKLFAPKTMRRRLCGNSESAGTSASQHLLVSKELDRPSRHRSLWSAIAWSYDLLEDDEKKLFQCMSIFVGGCTLRSTIAVCADEVCADARVAEYEVLELITSLLDKHLVVQTEQPDGEPRFAMLETIREFAFWNLEESGYQHALKERMACFYQGLVDELNAGLKRKGSKDALAVFDLELDNIRQVMRHASTDIEIEAALHISGNLANYWSRRNLRTEGENWCIHLLSLAKGNPPSQAQAVSLFTKAFLSASQGNVLEAKKYFERSLAMSRQVGPNSTISLSLALLGNNAWNRGDFESALRYFDEAEEVLHESDADWHIAMIRTNRAGCYIDLGELVLARDTLDANWPLLHKIGEQGAIHLAKIYTARLYYFEGNLAAAEQAFMALLEQAYERVDQNAIANSKLWLAIVLLKNKAAADVKRYVLDALSAFVELNAKRSIADALHLLITIAKEENQFEQVVLFSNVVKDFCVHLGYVFAPYRQEEIERAMESACQYLAPEQLVELERQSKSITIADAVGQVLPLGKNSVSV